MPTPKLRKPFVVNTHRTDPYKNFRFRVKYSGKIVAAADAVSGVQRKISGLHKTGDVTLKRGIVRDSDFANWVNRSSKPASSPLRHAAASQRKPLSRTFVIEMYDEHGNKAASWKLRGCVVSEVLQTRSKTGVAIESLTITPDSLEQV